MKKIKTIVITGMLILSPSQALALSCASSGFSLFETAKQYSSTNVNAIFVWGRFENYSFKKPQKIFNSAPKIQKGLIIQEAPRGIPKKGKAVFNGVQKTSDGEKEITLSIKVETNCVASWCGHLPKEGALTEAALFKSGKQYKLVSGPCSPNHFSRSKASDWKHIAPFVK